ncbi:MAG: LysM peptidoglycan-binding domain-containing protein [Alistipes sp.]|nr:LysM peptidoglycan-binding domain-containing protein [Alistipes sp.]
MLLVVALVATIQSSLMAQNIKTYNGALCKPNTMICALDVEVFNEVSYEYYENENYARVWHGRFTALYFRYKDDRSVVGSYEHGVQSGVWEESGVFYDLSYNFLNGKLHGDYHFESEDLVISAMFCDNHLSGSIRVVGQNGQFSLSGQFDEDGFACGEWEVKYLDYNRIPFIREYVYDKGQVLSIVEIDDSTGERTTYSDQNGEDRRLLSYSGLDSWFSYKMPLYDLLSRRFVNPFNKASYNDATATINLPALFQPMPMTSDKEVIAADGSVGFHTVEEGDTFGCLAVGAEGYNTTAVYHTVEAGDTFGHLAVKYETSTKRIQKLNPDVDPTRLIIGQIIRVK